MLVCSGFSLTFPTLYPCPFSSSASLPGWKVPQLGLLVGREVEWTDSSTRGLVEVRNRRNVVVAVRDMRNVVVGIRGVTGAVGRDIWAVLLWSRACVGRAPEWCKQQST